MENKNQTQQPVNQNENSPQKANSIDLSNVRNRQELLKFATLRGYDVQGTRIPLDFYKKEINLVDFARAVGYEYAEKTQRVSQGAFERQRWFYMEKKQMKFPELERDENASSQILISRRSEGPNSPNFKYNEHYYFSQQLAHSGDKKNHGSIVDLVQLHFKADFKDSIRIIENFVYKNNELKEKALPFHLKGTGVNEASSVKRLESYHNIRPLSDTAFLNSRGISDETIKHPHFKDRIHNSISEDGKHVNTAFPISSENGLIGFEVRNTDFKSVVDFKNDGFWRSNVDHANKVKELTLTESSIDALSKYELKSLQDPSFSKNQDGANAKAPQEVYLSTAGSITGNQIDLLQKMLDKGLSRKTMLLDQVPKTSLNDVAQVTTQKDERGRAVMDENNKPVQIAHVHYNKPEKLTIAFDNDTAGQMLTAKVLGRLNASDYFKVADKQDALRDTEITTYRNNKTNIGKLSWNVTSDSSEKVDKGVNAIKDHYADLNGKYKDKIAEGEPFKLTQEPLKGGGQTVEVEFKNINKTWNLAVDSIKELKFQNSKALEISRPILKDWNEDLKAVKGLDDVLKRKFDIYNSVNSFENKDQSKGNVMQNKEPKDDLMQEISKAMDRPKGVRM